MISEDTRYKPAQWEKITAASVAIFIVVLISFLVIRDRPFSDPNFPIFIRILISFACAYLGAVIPGFLQVDLRGRGMLIRAGGALALFVITFFFTPKVIHTTLAGKIDTSSNNIVGDATAINKDEQIGYVPYAAVASEKNGHISVGTDVVIREGGTNLRISPSLVASGQQLREGIRATVIKIEKDWVKIRLKP